MKKKALCLALVIVLCFSIAAPALAADMALMQANGEIFMSTSGRAVSFGGYSESVQDEDIIKVTVILWELRGSGWCEIARSSAQDEYSSYVSTSGSKTVTGGAYYKVTGIHYSSTNGKSYTVNSESSSKWIA